MASTPEPLAALKDWFLAQCGGDWEHGDGVSITSLDNPGWSIEVALAGTVVADRTHERREIHRGEHDWLVCWVESEIFRAACGPGNLVEAVSGFLDWAR